jgi:ribose transport system substrate-binding protein
VFVDQRVNAPGVYNATNDQVAYGRLGAEWLFKTLGGKGNVVEMRGIAGVPADTDRHKGFQQALKKYKGIKVVKQTFTGWQFANGGKQILDILNSGVKVDGVWTSGIDYTVVNAFKTANKKLVPVVGADNNGFLKQLKSLKGFNGAAVTNPATIGGVGVTVALRALAGQKVSNWVKLTPQVWTYKTKKALIDKYYSAKAAPDSSAQLEVKPYTTYSIAQLRACKGP